MELFRFVAFFSSVLLFVSSCGSETEDTSSEPEKGLTSVLLQSPDHNQFVTGTITLKWHESLDKTGGEVKYDLYFGDQSSPKIFKVGISETEYTLEAADIGSASKKYYWKVVAKGAEEQIKESSVQSFSLPSDYLQFEWISTGLVSDSGVYTNPVNGEKYSVRHFNSFTWMHKNYNYLLKESLSKGSMLVYGYEGTSVEEAKKHIDTAWWLDKTYSTNQYERVVPYENYGVLYTREFVRNKDSLQKILPDGWRLPTFNELTKIATLIEGPYHFPNFWFGGYQSDIKPYQMGQGGMYWTNDSVYWLASEGTKGVIKVLATDGTVPVKRAYLRLVHDNQVSN